MNNTQFFVAIGLPVASFLLVFMASTVINRNAIVDLRETLQSGLASNRAAIDDLRNALRAEIASESASLRAEMAAGFTAGNQRVDDLRSEMARESASLRSEMASGFAAGNQRVDDLRSETTAGFGLLNARVGRLEVRLDSIDNELRIGHERRIATLEAHVLGRAS